MFAIVGLDIFCLELDRIRINEILNPDISRSRVHEEEVLGIKVYSREESTLLGRPIIYQNFLVGYNLGEGRRTHSENVIILRLENREITHQCSVKVVLLIEHLEGDIVLGLRHVALVVDDECFFSNSGSLGQVLGKEYFDSCVI